MSAASKAMTMGGLGVLVVGSYLMTMRNAVKNTITDDDMEEAMARAQNKDVPDEFGRGADAQEFIREAEERRKKRES